MKRYYWLSIIWFTMLSATAGVCASPVCRVYVEQTAKRVIHHTAATLARWKAYNATPKGKAWVAKHPHGYQPKPLSAEGRALFDRVCAEMSTFDAHVDMMVDEPETESFSGGGYPIGDATRLDMPWRPDGGDRVIVSDTGGDEGGSIPPVFFPPVFLGGGSTPPPAAPVPEPPAILMMLIGAVAAAYRRAK